MKRVAIADIFTHTNRLSNENRLLIIAFIHRSGMLVQGRHIIFGNDILRLATPSSTDYAA
jgi:hypothetical protein